jgi:hypothetical protein
MASVHEGGMTALGVILEVAPRVTPDYNQIALASARFDPGQSQLRRGHETNQLTKYI